jgi:chromosome segregation ATPase
LRVHHGYAGQLTVTTPQNAGRTLTATLQVPSDQIDAVLAELKKLGRVEQESQAAEEVTRQFVDLTARLKNSRETEQRLITVLRERTGKVKDVLEVEQEIARVRGEIEQMDAERKNLERQVRYASLQLKLSEEYKAALEQPQPSAGTRLGNAVVEGFRDAIESGISFLVFLLSVGPWLVLWALLLFWPARLVWRRVRVLVAR